MKLKVIVTDIQRIPTVLTGFAIRVEKFTVTKMSTLRWVIDTYDTPEDKLVDLIDVLPVIGVEIHSLTP